MSQSTHTHSADTPHLEDLYRRIGIAAVAAAARYGRKDNVRTATHEAAPMPAEAAFGLRSA